LYSTADALGVKLAPGVRERQATPRYLTIALAGMVACTDALAELAEAKRLPTWLAYEWLVVMALVRQNNADTGIYGVPGRDKVITTLARQDVVCERTYLKSPSVFGFHGIYRVLGIKAGLFSDDGHPLAAGYRVLSAWQAEQGLDGFLENKSPGREFRVAIERTVRAGIDADHARDPAPSLRVAIAQHLNPHSPGPRESDALWEVLTSHDAIRGEYLTRLASPDGQRAWQEAGGSERAFHEWLAPLASPTLLQLLKAVLSYERLSRLLLDAFDEARWHMTNTRTPVDHTSLAQGDAMREAASHAIAAYADAVREIGEVDPAQRLRVERTLSWLGETTNAQAFAAALLQHHERVQRAKAPNGKRAWFDTYGDGRVAIRPAYTVYEFVQHPQRYVHAYRVKPLWSFAKDVGRLASSTGAE